ncbi:Rrf2 family transcriptional regulator [Endozoicomonas sp.]|uniref:Rrf2 family transcriptional regulator n=1 Tax=Endozoicomonas sp. TaxID=1892382 RepID=UPI002886F039|nr:Rrf2 family transcriptional regulator [Endozoicomonas sp.]
MNQELGYLRNVRGNGGGIELGMPPEQINIGPVVRDMEASLKVIDCSTPYCRLPMSAFFGVLDKYTLADLFGNREELIHLLDLDVSA